MRINFLILIVVLLPSLVRAQTTDTTNTAGRIGIAINSSLNGEVYPIRLVPSLSYLKGNSQFELGVGFHPFIRKDQRILSTEFNYKYFPNGTDNKFNMYVIGRLSYINNTRKTYYPSKYNYLFLNGGYGFQLNPTKNLYLGTNITIGTYTYGKRTEIPYEGFTKKDLFDEFGFNLAFQFNIGYRF